MQEQLYQQVPAGHQLPLKHLSALQPKLVFAAVNGFLLALAHHLVHPAGIQEHDLALFGDGLHIPLQKGIPLLLRGGAAHVHHLEEPGVQLLDQRADQAALAGRAPALNQHQYGQLVLLQLHLKRGQLFPALLQPGLLLALFPGRAWHPILQHCGILLFCRGYGPVYGPIVPHPTRLYKKNPSLC